MEPKRIEQNFKNIYRLEPLINRKLYIAIIIILRNTAAGRATIVLVNTSNGEIVTVLNFQEEFIAANTKIKQL